MKILLDECITKRFKAHLVDFEVYSVAELNLSGIKNGKLMSYCAENSFKVLLTIDKNLMFQQNLQKYPISIIVLNAKTSKLTELIQFLGNLKIQLLNIELHKAYLIEK